MSSRLEHRLFLFLVVTMVWSVAMRLQLGGVIEDRLTVKI
jgi:hypothetical protein